MAEAIAVSIPPVSLTDNSEDGGGQIDIALPSPEYEISDTLAVHQVLVILEEKDKRLIIMRYFKNLTQSVTATRLGMTQVQVSRREKKLLQFMREQLLL